MFSLSVGLFDFEQVERLDRFFRCATGRHENQHQVFGSAVGDHVPAHKMRVQTFLARLDSDRNRMVGGRTYAALQLPAPPRKLRQRSVAPYRVRLAPSSSSVPRMRVTSASRRARTWSAAIMPAPRM